MVKDDGIRPGVLDKIPELLQSPGPQAGGGVGLLPALGQDPGRFISGGGGQLPQLVNGELHFIFPGIHPGQNGGGEALGLIFVHRVPFLPDRVRPFSFPGRSPAPGG